MKFEISVMQRHQLKGKYHFNHSVISNLNCNFSQMMQKKDKNNIKCMYLGHMPTTKLVPSRQNSIFSKSVISTREGYTILNSRYNNSEIPPVGEK